VACASAGEEKDFVVVRPDCIAEVTFRLRLGEMKPHGLPVGERKTPLRETRRLPNTEINEAGRR
jgi:hypothetical protein